MTRVVNPVVRGFAADPSAIRVGEHFYLATSSFQWYPAIPIHRSRDLVTWERIGAVADGPETGWDVRGVADSCGTWAPSLSHDGRRFWLVASIVREESGGELGLRTLLTRSTDPAEGWDPPVRVPSTGFDPALFHEDGRVWLLNMQWDSRPGRSRFAGITLQELDAENARPLGPPQLILDTGTLIEGPNLYRTAQGYLLTVAEGGTGWNHGISSFRAQRIGGPYHRDPGGPLLTTRDDPGHPLQRAGHGELVTDAAGETFLVHLASRVATRDGERRSLLGRETVLQPIVWDADGWPRLAHGGTLPAREVEVTLRDDVDGRAEPWCSLRRGSQGWARIAADGLDIVGGDGLSSHGDVSLLARRIHEPDHRAEALVVAEPHRIEHAAGLVLYYGTGDYVAALRTVDDAGEPVVVLRSRDAGNAPRELAARSLPRRTQAVRLSVRTQGLRSQFALAVDGGPPLELGPRIDFLTLADEHGPGLRFTGPMAGVVVIDELEGAWSARFTDLIFELGVAAPAERAAEQAVG